MLFECFEMGNMIYKKIMSDFNYYKKECFWVRD